MHGHAANAVAQGFAVTLVVLLCTMPAAIHMLPTIINLFQQHVPTPCCCRYLCKGVRARSGPEQAVSLGQYTI